MNRNSTLSLHINWVQFFIISYIRRRYNHMYWRNCYFITTSLYIKVYINKKNDNTKSERVITLRIRQRQTHKYTFIYNVCLIMCYMYLYVKAVRYILKQILDVNVYHYIHITNVLMHTPLFINNMYVKCNIHLYTIHV